MLSASAGGATAYPLVGGLPGPSSRPSLMARHTLGMARKSTDRPRERLRLISSLDHLPEAKRRDLERVLEILFREFEAATGNKSSPRKRGSILKVVLL
jgi:hypothetical protein